MVEKLCSKTGKYIKMKIKWSVDSHIDTWWRMNHEYLGKDVDNLVEMAMARTTECECRILGHSICTCASSSYMDERAFSRPFGESIYSLHSPPNRNLGASGHYIRWPHYHYGSPSDKVKLDEIVDHCLLEPIIEIEASL
jgi:hypothetical protein